MEFILNMTDDEIQDLLRNTHSTTLAIALIDAEEKIKEKTKQFLAAELSP